MYTWEGLEGESTTDDKKVWDWHLTASQMRVEIWWQWMQEEINPGEVMTKEQSGPIIMGVC